MSEGKNGKWKTTGLTNAEALLRDFWNTINNPGKVSINLLSDTDVRAYTTPHGDVILVIHVPRAKREQKPVFIDNDLFNGTYRRNGEGDYRCSRAEVKGMVRDETEESVDMKVLETMSLADLNKETVQAYRNRHKAYSGGHVWESLDDVTYLERIGAAKRSDKDGQLHPTAAGLLMFGEEYRILYEFPEYFLDYREMLDPTIRWTDRLQSSSGEWTGNLFDFYFRVYSKLQKDVKVPFKLEGIFRVDDTPVHKALREALANCLINADFHFPRGVVIRKDGDTIVMENPGCIRTGKAQMLKGGISDPRNKALMKMFNLLGIGERAGSGVPSIFAVWEQQGWEQPLLEEQYGPDRTLLTLSLASQAKKKAAIKSGDKKVAINVTDTEEGKEVNGKKTAIKSGDKKVAIKTQQHHDAILQHMQEGQEYALADFIPLLGVQKSRVRILVGELVALGKLKTKGANRNRKYVKV